MTRAISGGLAAQDLPGLGSLLEPSRDIDGVADDEEVAARVISGRHHLTGVDPETDRQSLTEDVVLPRPIAELDGRRQRPFGVIAVSLRHSEHREDRITDELLERAAMAADHVIGQGEQPAEQSPHILRIEALPERGGADNVGEQDSDETSLLWHAGHRTGKAAGLIATRGTTVCRSPWPNDRDLVDSRPSPSHLPVAR